MTITIHPNKQDMALIRAQALARNTTVEEFTMDAVRKAANNAEYLAMLDKSRKQLQEGKVVRKTMEELEAMASE
jgi:uncharacterized protein (DUF1778 family)